MKILLISLNLIGQGTFWRAFQLGQHLSRRGNNVTLMATSRYQKVGIKEQTHRGITLIDTPDLFSGSLRSGWDPWNTLNRINWIHRRKFDLVHAFESRPTVLFPALYLAYSQHTPLVMDWADWFGRGGSVEERPNPIVRTILRPVETFFEERFRTRANGTTVICSALWEKALALGVPEDKLLMLPNGSDTERLQNISKDDARERVHLPKDAFILGYIGSIFPRDAHFMTRAFDLVCEQIPNALLLSIGRQKMNLKEISDHPGSIHQSGYIDSQYLNDYMASCDVFWLPLSDTKANQGRFPLKINDYMAVGRPIIATAVGDIPSIYENVQIGLLSPAEEEEFANQTISLYKDQHMQEYMGKHARLLAETRYNWNILAQKLEKFYQDIICHIVS